MNDFERMKRGEFLNPIESDFFDDLFWEANASVPEVKEKFSVEVFKSLLDGAEPSFCPYEKYRNIQRKRKFNQLFEKHNIKGSSFLEKKNNLSKKLRGEYNSICFKIWHVYANKKLTFTRKQRLDVRLYAKWLYFSSFEKRRYFDKIVLRNKSLFVKEIIKELHDSFKSLNEYEKLVEIKY